MIRRGATIVILLALALAAFLLIDFQLARSSTSVDSQVGTASNNQPAPGRVPVYVWVEEKDALSTALRDQLVRELARGGRYDPVLLPSAKPGAGDVPLLRVWIERPGLSWTPVYAQADMQVRFGFSSYTTAIDFETDAAAMLPSEGWGVYTDGTLAVKDRTFGLVSLPAYWRYLAGKAAQGISEELGKIVK